MKIRLQSAPWHEGVEIIIFEPDENGRRCVARRIEFSPLEEGAFAEPTCRLGRAEAQVLLDDLWAAGYRPTSERIGPDGLKNIERHLQDMRAIAFSKLRLDKP